MDTVRQNYLLWLNIVRKLQYYTLSLCRDAELTGLWWTGDGGV